MHILQNLLPNKNDRIFIGRTFPSMTKREWRHCVGQFFQGRFEAIVIQTNLLLVFDATQHHKQDGESFEYISASKGVYYGTLRARSGGLDDDLLRGLDNVINQHILDLGDLLDEKSSLFKLAEVLECRGGVRHLDGLGVEIEKVCGTNHCD